MWAGLRDRQPRRRGSQVRTRVRPPARQQRLSRARSSQQPSRKDGSGNLQKGKQEKGRRERRWRSVGACGPEDTETEKGDAPAQVDRQLQGEERQRPTRGVAIGHPPDPPSGNAHHHEERCPDRAEHPVRRIERRLVQRRIPLRQVGHRHGATQPADADADADQQGESQQVLAGTEIRTFCNHYRRLAPTLMVRARIAVLNTKETMPWTSVTRLMAGETVPTSPV